MIFAVIHDWWSSVHHHYSTLKGSSLQIAHINHTIVWFNPPFQCLLQRLSQKSLPTIGSHQISLIASIIKVRIFLTIIPPSASYWNNTSFNWFKTRSSWHINLTMNRLLFIISASSRSVASFNAQINCFALKSVFSHCLCPRTAFFASKDMNQTVLATFYEPNHKIPNFY